METIGYEVEARPPGDNEHDRWFAERFGGHTPALAVYVRDLDAVVVELGVEGPITAHEEGGRSVVVTGPAGQPVEVVQPAPPEEGEARIAELIERSEPLAGPPTDELLAGVLAVVAETWDRMEHLLDGVAHNKVLATMLLASRQARDPDVRPDSPVYWQRSAASTLLSGFVGRGAAEAPTDPAPRDPPAPGAPTGT